MSNFRKIGEREVYVVTQTSVVKNSEWLKPIIAMWWFLRKKFKKFWWGKKLCALLWANEAIYKWSLTRDSWVGGFHSAVTQNTPGFSGLLVAKLCELQCLVGDLSITLYLHVAVSQIVPTGQGVHLKKSSNK